MARSKSVADIWFIDRPERLEALEKRIEEQARLPKPEAKDGAQDTAYWGNAGWWDANWTSFNEEGGYGIINVSDELFDMPSWFGTDYRSLAKAVEQLSNNKKCKFIVMNINSPGGMMSGLFEFCEVLRTCGKPVYAYVGNWACSAAYAIASSCARIYATPTSEVGSVGAIYHILDTSKYYQNLGVEEITIAARHSENKHLDYKSEAGRKRLQERIDKAEAFLIDHIAKCRGVTPDDVLEKYGHGDVFYSDEALTRGMVDELVTGLDQCIEKIKNPSSAVETTAATATAKAKAETGEARGELMTIEELKSQYPDLCEQLEKEATAKATAGEKERTEAAVKAELERRDAILAFGKVDDPEFKAFVEKAVAEGTSVADFKVEAATMLLNIKAKAPATNSETREDGQNDDFLKEEAEESAKAEVRTKGKTEDMKDPEAFFENELKKLSFED